MHSSQKMSILFLFHNDYGEIKSSTEVIEKHISIFCEPISNMAMNTVFIADERIHSVQQNDHPPIKLLSK